MSQDARKLAFGSFEERELQGHAGADPEERRRRSGIEGERTLFHNNPLDAIERTLVDRG